MLENDGNMLENGRFWVENHPKDQSWEDDQAVE